MPSRAAPRLLAVLAVVVSLAACGGSVGRSARHHPAPATGGAGATGPATRPATIVAGADGVTSSAIVTENARPGTTGWKLSGPHQGTANGIAGYADEVQAEAGDRVHLHVSTTAASWHVEAYRLGWYAGTGGRRVWTSSDVPGVDQPTCPVLRSTNTVECRWTAGLTVPITADWVPGEYLLKLVGSGGEQSYVPLTVWDPASTATYVVMDAPLTEQAFDAWGGYDYYTGATPCAPGVYPCSSRARVVSFDRPYTGAGDGGLLSLTYPLTRLAEEHGLDVTYWTDLTLAEHGDLLVRHRVLLSPGHDEEWSLSMRTAATAALHDGTNLAFFGASPVLRKVRLQASPLGADREVVNYRDPSADPLLGTDDPEVSQNSWDQQPAGDPSSTLVGATYIGYANGPHFPLVDTDPGSWLWAGTGLGRGGEVPGVETSDFQEFQPGEAGPQDVEVQAHSPVEVEGHGAMHADTSYYTLPDGAGVWQSGTNGWIPALGQCVPDDPCPSATLQRMTLNVLAVLGAGPLGTTHPAHPTD